MTRGRRKTQIRLFGSFSWHRVRLVVSLEAWDHSCWPLNNMSSSKSLRLYRSLLRAVEVWHEGKSSGITFVQLFSISTASANPQTSLRYAFFERIRHDFRANKNESDSEKIAQLQAFGESQLAAAQRLLDNAHKTKVCQSSIYRRKCRTDWQQIQAETLMKNKPMRPSKTEEGRKGSWRNFFGLWGNRLPRLMMIYTSGLANLTCLEANAWMLARCGRLFLLARQW